MISSMIFTHDPLSDLAVQTVQFTNRTHKNKQRHPPHGSVFDRFCLKMKTFVRFGLPCTRERFAPKTEIFKKAALSWTDQF